MRIACFAGVFPLVSETFVVRQVADLLELGHDVSVFSADRPPPGVPAHPDVERHRLLDRTTYVDMPQASRHELPVRPLRGETWVPGAETAVPNRRRLLAAAPAAARAAAASPRLAADVLRPSRYGYEAESLSALYRLRALAPVRRGSFDVLHAHFGPIGNAFRFAKALWGAPLVVSFHGYDFSTWPRRHGPSVYRELFATADAVTANSAYTRGRLVELGCPPERLHVLPMGVDRAAFAPPRPREPRSGGLRVLTVARLVEIKGIAYALQAFARLHAGDPDARYDVVGDGPLRADLERLAAELGVASAVTFHGALGPDAVRPLLWDADVFVLPSVTVEGDQEGQGVVLLEAQAAGVPVVATDTGGLPGTLLSGRTGLLVPEREAGALAAALEELAGDPGRRAAMGAAGRAHVAERFDHRALAGDLVALYERVRA